MKEMGSILSKALFAVLVLAPLVGCYGFLPVTYNASIGGVLGVGGAPTEISMDLGVSKGCAKPGDKVTIRYTVTNRGPGKLVVQLNESPPVMDIVIQVNTRENEKEFVRWSDGKSLTDELRQLVLEPEQSKTISMDWTVDPRTQTAFIDMVFRYYESPLRGRSAGVNLYVTACPGF